MPDGKFLAFPLAGASVALTAVAVALLRRRIPTRRDSESADDLWRNPVVATSAILFW